MIGRASIGYPWIFREIKHYMETGQLLPPPTTAERVNAAREPSPLIEWKGPKLGVLEMRRHYTNYFRGYAGIKAFRARLVTERTSRGTFTKFSTKSKRILQKWLSLIALLNYKQVLCNCLKFRRFQ